jgi:hypothetical protein
MTPFSETTIEAILAAFPDWKPFVRQERGRNGDVYAIVEAPAPAVANTADGLWITTENDEVTVWFDRFHSHFDCWEVMSNGDAASSFVEDLLNERIVVASTWRGDEWLSAWPERAGDPVETPPSGIRLRIRSWRGRFNEDRDA